MKMYSVFDHVASYYFIPFFSRDDTTAMRDFATVVNMVGNVFNSNPQDFSLHRLGEFDEITGVLNTSNFTVCNALSLLTIKGE